MRLYRDRFGDISSAESGAREILMKPFYVAELFTLAAAASLYGALVSRGERVSSALGFAFALYFALSAILFIIQTSTGRGGDEG